MKAQVRRGVIVIIVITMGTSLMVVYNNSFTDTSGTAYPTDAAATGPQMDKPRKAQPKPGRALSSTLQGYTGVIDQKPLRMHCNCCALVTSSGHLTGSNRGDEIDSTECVIRMNDAPTGGSFQRDVGRRTSLRVIAHSSMQRVLRSRQELLNASQDSVFLFWGPSSCMRRDGKGRVFNNLRMVNQLLPKLKVYVISQLKMPQFDELFKKETGRDRAPSHLSVPYHYYEPSGPDECAMYLSHERNRHGSHHRFITEKTVFANWARMFDIHFYQPDWTPSSTLNGNSSLTPASDGS
ncbi:alpha-N-acetylgalactosaminide alpha-2,6-sialyltransferase 5 isoform X3 [Oncorhynchus kisutch]|uniref:alpha-N-acetylgalactosaminide alpha-2,6-sialyltransferase 5 isoform X3 n=1 Tax=Oncorhynchus kisutch TaxID=8019 RepID=UPI0012DFC614|nr:alpha-N-acetylgalactosaminide alpha-2,6-sialyltransferase 5 isoform X3 [Oncorhynchus kisutch]